MGRPQKDGLDYFPLDVHMDDSIALIEADYGVEGFGIIIKLYQQIYSNGYYLQVDNKRMKLISRAMNVDTDLLEEVILLAVEYGIFNKKLHKKYNILTSKGIQKRYFFASLRRLSINFYKEYLLLGVNDNINLDNVNIYSINVTETLVNDSSNSHSIVKDNDSKEYIYMPYLKKWNKIKSLPTHGEAIIRKGFKKKHEDILNLYPEEDILSAIESYGIIIGSNDYWYTHRFTFLRFLDKIDTFVPNMKPLENYKTKTYSSTVNTDYNRDAVIGSIG